MNGRGEAQLDSASRRPQLGEYSTSWASRTYFSFILPFMGVCSFNKQNVWDVPQVIEEETTVPQVRATKRVELGILGF